MISLEDQIKCVKREIVMREQVYPRWAAVGKMPQALAIKELEIMKKVLSTLEDYQYPDGDDR